MANLCQQSTTTYPLFFLMVDSTDHLTGKTGLTPTVTLSKNGAGYGAAAGAVSEIGNGLYKVAGNATDSGTLGELWLHATATGADPTDVAYAVVAYDPFTRVLPANSIVNESIADGALTAVKFGNDTTVKALLTGTAVAAGASTITLDGSAVGVSNYYDGQTVQIVSGTGAGQARVVTGYTSGKIATVSDAWATQPTAGSVYIIHPLGDVEVSVNNDKTGYALSSSQSFNLTGNVTGNLTGSVGSVTGAVTLPTMPADWVSAAGISAVAVTKVQAGLSTYTGTDTTGTATLLTRLPSALTVTSGKVDVNDKTGFALAASQHVIVDSGTVTNVTNDVGITQTGADKVWGSATRTLSSFGTLVADVAAAVWGAATRTLSAFGFTVNANDTTGTTTLLARLTSTRANYLDNLDTAVSSRSTYSGADTLGTTTLLSRIPAFPANFPSLGISAAGKINEVVLTGTTTNLTNAPSGGLDAAGVRSAVGLANANLDTQLGNISAKTANLPTDPASATQVATRMAAFIYTAPDNTSITAIKAKTDNLPASPAAVGSSMVLASDYDAAKTAAQESTLTAMKGMGFDTSTDSLHQIRSNVSAMSASDLRAAFGLAAANLDTQLATKPALTAIVNGILDALVLDHQVSGSFAKAVGDASLLGDPWNKQFLVPGSDPAEYVSAGDLLFQLFIAPYIQPVAPAGAPDDITLCRVTGRFELPDGTWANKVPVQFDLVVPGGGPAKSDNIIVQVQIVTSTDTQGYLVYKGHQWVDLERNDFITPAGTSWTVTSELLGFDATPFELVARTFNLGTLIA